MLLDGLNREIRFVIGRVGQRRATHLDRPQMWNLPQLVHCFPRLPIGCRMNTIIRVVRKPLKLRGIPYDLYEKIRDAPGNDSLRITYYDGVMEFMAPLEFRHEYGRDSLGMIVRAYAAVFKLDCEGAGSTTFRKGKPGKMKGKGKEPDLSFYFGENAEAVRQKQKLDLKVDPPPDLWIEVDNTGSSKGGLPLYAELGVPEVWRYRTRRGKLWFGSLKNGQYTEIQRSIHLPKLTPDIVLDLIGETRKLGQTGWDIWMRDWMDTTLRTAND